MIEAAILRRWFGVDPGALTYAQWAGYLGQIGEIADMESGTVSHERMSQRIARQSNAKRRSRTTRDRDPGQTQEV
jgi:hypothetical protein